MRLMKRHLKCHVGSASVYTRIMRDADGLTERIAHLEHFPADGVVRQQVGEELRHVPQLVRLQTMDQGVLQDISRMDVAVNNSCQQDNSTGVLHAHMQGFVNSSSEGY